METSHHSCPGVQASALRALPRVDTETAQSLRRSSSSSEPLPSQPPPSAAADTPPTAIPVEDFQLGTTPEGSQPELLLTRSTSTLDSDSANATGDAQPGPSLLTSPPQSSHIAQTSNLELDQAYRAPTASQSVLSIPHTSTAQSLVYGTMTASAASSVLADSRPARHSGSAVACHCAADSATLAQAHPSLSSACCAGSAASRMGVSCGGGRGLVQGLGQRQGRAARQVATALVGGAPATSRITGFTASKSPHSSWRLHAVGAGHTTAESADSAVGESSLGSSDDQPRAESSTPHGEAHSSSESSVGSESAENGSTLLSTQHDEATLSSDVANLPEGALTPLPKPHPTTPQPDSKAQSSDASDAAMLLSPNRNESTASHDTDSQPNPPELVRPPVRPKPPSIGAAQGAQANATLGWEDLSPERPSKGAQPKVTSSWDNLQPLFRGPLRTDGPREPQEPPNDAAAADVLFNAIQNKRYRHEKGTSYVGATFALVPIDRKVR